ncbi:hypothetical protein HZ992_16500 [Rhizobacter sp. AJA081-3]|uniref:hypothetical protein n=1 Tax=Rhizobacter sp. AJA081-3 TaxID=2753607 RepID=UPI001ADF51BE|nr:hypothetical protein [Rhizobacter sp. AJA081-3]QTN21767.1 hypothetical protein HZ992_16500 [Rhizobacter sp. AJA081-3]
MQDVHRLFFDFLKGLTGGDEIVAAYKEYKAANDASAFELNGHLKSGLSMPPKLLTLSASLKQAICAQNKKEIKLYRMTSDAQFMGPLLSALEGAPIRYPAFMSTSGTTEGLHTFVPPAPEVPLVLEITCPPGTLMGLMEAHQGAAEDEYLLGCGTVFRVTQLPEVLKPSDAFAFAGYAAGGRDVKKLGLTVHASPPYAGKEPLFRF